MYALIDYNISKLFYNLSRKMGLSPCVNSGFEQFQCQPQKHCYFDESSYPQHLRLSLSPRVVFFKFVNINRQKSKKFYINHSQVMPIISIRFHLNILTLLRSGIWTVLGKQANER